MNKGVQHYAIMLLGRKHWVSACGLPFWQTINLWTKKEKVTCKRCKKTKIFKKIK